MTFPESDPIKSNTLTLKKILSMRAWIIFVSYILAGIDFVGTKSGNMIPVEANAHTCERC